MNIERQLKTRFLETLKTQWLLQASLQDCAQWRLIHPPLMRSACLGASTDCELEAVHLLFAAGKAATVAPNLCSPQKPINPMGGKYIFWPSCSFLFPSLPFNTRLRRHGGLPSVWKIWLKLDTCSFQMATCYLNVTHTVPGNLVFITRGVCV